MSRIDQSSRALVVIPPSPTPAVGKSRPAISYKCRVVHCVVMTAVTGEELVLVAVLRTGTASDEAGDVETDCSVSELLRTVRACGHRLTVAAELGAAIGSLIESGLLEWEAAAIDGDASVFLTDAGWEHARECRAELEAREIELVEGSHREERTIDEVATELGRSPIEIAIGCTDDGRYYPGKRRERQQTDLVGRETECRRWQRNLDRVRRERSGLGVVLTGPAGIGRTTLADRLLKHARTRDCSVHRTWCRPADGEPCRPIRALLERPRDIDWSALDGTDETAAEDGNLGTLFDAITERIAPAADEPPRVWYLDDLHLADAATHRYLEFLFDRLAAVPIVVLASMRPAELPAESPVAAEAVPEDAPVLQFDLDPLGREGTRAIVERIADCRDVPESFVAAVLGHTGGNPLFAEAAIETLLTTDQLDPYFEWHPTRATKLELPATTGETVRRNVDTLDEHTRELLRWAAAGGRTVPVAALEAVLERPSERVAPTVELLVETGMFDRTAVDPRRTVTFRSETIRTALLAELDEEERRRRRAEFAAATETLAAPADGGARDENRTTARNPAREG